MANSETIAYNVAVFISTLFLLEFGADKFVDHTAIVARRTGIPDTVIALLTAGAEWEELLVVVASLAQGRSSLAVGNIIGSAISNILGAFSLGLLFRPTGSHVEFDSSSRIYSLCLLVITTFVAPILYFSQRIVWLLCGSILIGLFSVYLFSIGWAISRGSLTAPDGSDDESSDDESDASSIESAASVRSPLLPSREEHEPEDSEWDQRVDGSPSTAVVTNVSSHRRKHGLGYHIGFLILGFSAICLSGYVLSHAAINVTDAIGVSDVLFGIVILAIATTLPEKFVAVLSGNRGHLGILVANTVGSNVFLLLLCLGIVMVDTSGNFDGVFTYPCDLGAINLSAGFPDPDLTSRLEPNIDENKDHYPIIDFWGYGTAGRPKQTTKKNTSAYEAGGSDNDGDYKSRSGSQTYQGRSTTFASRTVNASLNDPWKLLSDVMKPVKSSLGTSSIKIDERKDASTDEALCKHQKRRAQKDQHYQYSQ
ncbi:hypothetical protein FCOIX_10044 [Fusarium coicis]|nr:hypothetical protein FCOIX_10044 [Fusarium coicis]